MILLQSTPTRPRAVRRVHFACRSSCEILLRGILICVFGSVDVIMMNLSRSVDRRYHTAAAVRREKKRGAYRDIRWYHGTPVIPPTRILLATICCCVVRTRRSTARLVLSCTGALIRRTSTSEHDEISYLAGESRKATDSSSSSRKSI